MTLELHNPDSHLTSKNKVIPDLYCVRQCRKVANVPYVQIIKRSIEKKSNRSMSAYQFEWHKKHSGCAVFLIWTYFPNLISYQKPN